MQKGGMLLRALKCLIYILLMGCAVLHPLVAFCKSVDVKADNMVFDVENGVIRLSGNVVCKGKDFIIKSDKAQILQRKKKVTFDGNVYLKSLPLDISCIAKSGSYLTEKGILELSGDVVLQSPKGKIKASCIEINFKTQTYMAWGSVILTLQEAVRVSASYVCKKENKAFFKKGVSYSDDTIGLFIKGKEAVIVWDKKDLNAPSYITVKGDVWLKKLYKKKKITAEAGSAYYDVAKAKIKLKDGVKVVEGKNTLEAKTVIIDLKTADIKAIGKTKAVIHVQ